MECDRGKEPSSFEMVRAATYDMKGSLSFSSKVHPVAFFLVLFFAVLSLFIASSLANRLGIYR